MEELEHFKGGSTLWEPLAPGKDMMFHEVDYGQNKYEFYLDMWDTPRVWRDEVLLDIKEV